MLSIAECRSALFHSLFNGTQQQQSIIGSKAMKTNEMAHKLLNPFEMEPEQRLLLLQMIAQQDEALLSEETKFVNVVRGKINSDK